MNQFQAQLVVQKLTDLIEAVIDDKVTYPESGNFIGVNRAKGDLVLTLTDELQVRTREEVPSLDNTPGPIFSPSDVRLVIWHDNAHPGTWFCTIPQNTPHGKDLAVAVTNRLRGLLPNGSTFQ